MSGAIVRVVVPVWNGENQIGRCLDALIRQTLSPDLFEVVVVDNGSTDGTCDVVRTYEAARLMVDPRPGSYSARNRGLEGAMTPYLAFTDADCIPEPDWLEKGVSTLRINVNAGIVAGRIQLFRTSPQDSELCEAYDRLFTLNQREFVQAGGCATANWMSPTRVMKEVGGFDAGMKSGGDFECAKRIRARGYVLVYGDDVVVRHPARKDVVEVMLKRRRILGGQWALRRREVSAIRLAANNLRWGLLRVWKAAGAKEIRLMLRCRLVLLLCALTVVALFELVRLEAGGEPRRS